jgi:hypothetical protein
MALLEDQIEEAQAAFIAAHDAKDVEGAQVLADHLRDLQAQQAATEKAILESSKEGTNLRNPLIASAVGSAVGAAVNPVRGAIHNIITPQQVTSSPKITTPAPSDVIPKMGGENWTHTLTGVNVPGSQMNKESLDTAQRMAQTVSRTGPLAGGSITEGGIMLGPEIGAKPPKPAPFIPRTLDQAKQSGKNVLTGLVADAQPSNPFSIVKGGARGAFTGAAAADIPQQLSQDNYGTAAADTGIAAGNILHGIARTKKGKAISSLLGIGSGVTRAVQGVNELMPEEQKAEGGLIHLAGGGVANALTQTAINAPFIAPTATGIAKNVGKGAYAPAIEDAASLGLAMAPLNPVTAAMSLMAPGEAGAGSTRKDWERQKAEEAIAHQKAQKQIEHEEFMRTQVGSNAPKYFEDYLVQKARAVPKFGIGGEVLKSASKNIKLPSQTFRAAPEQTVANPLRNAYPGVYKRPDVIAQEAAAKVAPEDPMLKRLFGVTRDDLYEMSKRQGNTPGIIPGASVNPKGSAAAASIMTPRNEQRLLDVLSEVKNKAPELHTGMHGWYTMDPQYHRMVELMGEEKAKQMYHRLNTFGGIESPNMPVPGEFNRATAAHWLAEQGRMPDWIKYGGMKDKELVAGMPQDIVGVPGRVGHQRASTSQQKFMQTGEHGMDSPKAPPYIQASSVPELGFQTDLPVGDAHWSRFLGLPDVRTAKGFSASVSTPELQQLAPWWKNKIAEPSGLESVPAQAILWGAGSPQTGVKTAIGAGKLELQSIEIAKAAQRLGVTPETARDLILMGKERAGKAEGGPIDSYAPGGKVGAAKKLFEEAQAAYKAKFTPGFYHGSPSNKIEAFDPTKSAKDPMYITPKATFVTRDPEFAESFLSMNNSGKVKSGSTMYPVNVNLGQHWNPNTPEGQQLIADFIAKYPKRVNLEKGLKRGDWTAVENSDFLTHLKDTGHDTFHVMEGGVPNVGVLKPENIRGKFAEFNPEHAADPDFMKAAGGAVENYDVGGKVVRSGLTELLQLMKNQGGAGAAQRLERAADLVPNLEHQYQPQALKEAFSNNRSLVSVMNPADFEKYAAPISSETKSSLSKSRRIGEPGPGQDYTHMPLGTYDDYIKYLQQFSEPGGGGFRSMPYLQLGQRKGFSFPNIQGHEGRHRTDALARQGNQSTLIGIEPRPELRDLPRNTQEEYLNAFSKEVGGKSPFVMPQESEVKRGLIELPEMFKKGGKV